jgi:phosphoesterase RecJ-like protein
MESVLVAIMFRELPGGQVKVSLRSKGQLDVHRLAGEFGGGGHRNASGIVMKSRMDDAVRIVIDRATGMLAAAADEGGQHDRDRRS